MQYTDCCSTSTQESKYEVQSQDLAIFQHTTSFHNRSRARRQASPTPKQVWGGDTRSVGGRMECEAMLLLLFLFYLVAVCCYHVQ